jgi:hypothetical protein
MRSSVYQRRQNSISAAPGRLLLLVLPVVLVLGVLLVLPVVLRGTGLDLAGLAVTVVVQPVAVSGLSYRWGRTSTPGRSSNAPASEVMTVRREAFAVAAMIRS